MLPFGKIHGGDDIVRQIRRAVTADVGHADSFLVMSWKFRGILPMMQDIRLPDAPEQPDIPRRISCKRM